MPNHTDPNPPTVKPGRKSTEFWLILAMNVLTVVAQQLEAVDTEWALIALALVNGLYAVGRSWVKGLAAAYLLCLVVLPAAGCQMSPTQRGAAITRTYTAAVEGMTAAADAGLVDAAEAERFEAIRAEASAEIDAMWAAVLAGQPFDARRLIQRAESIVDRLYQQQLQRERDDDPSRSIGAGAWLDPSRPADPRTDRREQRAADAFARADRRDPAGEAHRRGAMGSGVATPARPGAPARDRPARLTRPTPAASWA